MKLPPSLKKPKQPSSAEDAPNESTGEKPVNSEDIPQESVKNLWRPIVVRCVRGHSMMPVLPPGTYVWGRSWFSRLNIGDIVIFLHDGREKIKRISDIRENEVYLLGDHEETSTDSRHFGWIDSQQITAKIFWPHAPKERAETAS